MSAPGKDDTVGFDKLAELCQMDFATAHQKGQQEFINKHSSRGFIEKILSNRDYVDSVTNLVPANNILQSVQDAGMDHFASSLIYRIYKFEMQPETAKKFTGYINKRILDHTNNGDYIPQYLSLDHSLLDVPSRIEESEFSSDDFNKFLSMAVRIKDLKDFHGGSLVDSMRTAFQTLEFIQNFSDEQTRIMIDLTTKYRHVWDHLESDASKNLIAVKKAKYKNPNYNNDFDKAHQYVQTIFLMRKFETDNNVDLIDYFNYTTKNEF